MHSLEYGVGIRMVMAVVRLCWSLVMSCCRKNGRENRPLVGGLAECEQKDHNFEAAAGPELLANVAVVLRICS